MIYSKIDIDGVVYFTYRNQLEVAYLFNINEGNGKKLICKENENVYSVFFLCKHFIMDFTSYILHTCYYIYY